MVEIRPLQGIDTDTIFTAWDDAFSDYARTWTKAELERDLQRRGFSPGISFGAFEGQRLVSFILNAAGTFNGVKTAYDTGTGTIKEYAGKGLASVIFKESLPFLQKQGFEKYLLE